MRRTLILVSMVVLLASSVGAVYDPNESYDGDMHIMAGGGEAGPPVSVTVNQTGSQCTTGNDTGVHEVAVDAGDTGATVTMTGTLQGSNPCQVIEHTVSEENGTVIVDLESVAPDEGQMCVQCLGSLSYTATIELAERMPVEVRHGGDRVSSLSASELSQDGSGKSGTAIGADDGAAADGSDNATEQLEFTLETGRLQVTKQGGSCHTGDQDDAVTDTSVDPTENGYSVGIEGYLQASNPCHRVDASVYREDGTYVLNLSSVDGGEMCVDCVGQLSYHVGGNFEEDFELEIRHDGRTVDTVSGTSENDGPGGFLAGIVDFFGGLFSL